MSIQNSAISAFETSNWGGTSGPISVLLILSDFGAMQLPDWRNVDSGSVSREWKS
jgi:hypothetical protein